MFKLAIRDYSAAININKNNPDLYYKRSRAFEAIRNYPKSLSDLNKYIVLKKHKINENEKKDLKQRATILNTMSN